MVDSPAVEPVLVVVAVVFDPAACAACLAFFGEARTRVAVRTSVRVWMGRRRMVVVLGSIVSRESNLPMMEREYVRRRRDSRLKKVGRFPQSLQDKVHKVVLSDDYYYNNMAQIEFAAFNVVYVYVIRSNGDCYKPACNNPSHM